MEHASIWPSDSENALNERVAVLDGPDKELAVILLANGCTPEFIKVRANFPTIASVRFFAKDSDIRERVREQRKERTERVGDKALVRLEEILDSPLKDAKAQVMAIRAGLDVGGALHKDSLPQTKQVSDLSVGELNELIAMTKQELASRNVEGIELLGQYPPPGHQIERNKGS